jgi:isopentenyldiphosphate isomerase
MESIESKLCLENTKEEMVALVDSNDNLIGSITRKQMRAENLPHRSSSIFIFNPITNQFAIQKRSMKKEFFPGYFDLTTGGVLGTGEDIHESAHRELFEEMGVTLKNKSDLVFIGKLFTSDEFSQAWHYIYYLKYDEEFILSDGEVEYVAYWSKDQIIENIKNNVKITPDSAKCFTFLLENKIDI